MIASQNGQEDPENSGAISREYLGQFRGHRPQGLIQLIHGFSARLSHIRASTPTATEDSGPHLGDFPAMNPALGDLLRGPADEANPVFPGRGEDEGPLPLASLEGIRSHEKLVLRCVAPMGHHLSLIHI